MLTLTRTVGQVLYIGNNIELIVESIEEKNATICVKASNLLQNSKFNKSLQIIRKNYSKKFTCKAEDIIDVSNDIKISIIFIKGNQVSIGIEADKSISITRAEAVRKPRTYDLNFAHR